MNDDTAEAFTSWALDRARTVEERFGAQLLIEHFARHGGGYDWQRLLATTEARKLNPAWEPGYTEAQIQATAGKLAALTDWRTDVGNDRPLRDLSVLRFLPGLCNFNLGHNAEVSDLSPLRHCPALKSVSLAAKDLEDFRPLADCPALESIRVFATFPWPRLEGWERLERLEALHWTGPGTGFLSLTELPALERLHISTGDLQHGGAASLRDFTQLPAMPRLRELWASTFYYLDGIERYPGLISLMVRGPFRTAAPVTVLPRLAHLHLSGHEFREVKSLTAAPALRQLVVESQRPHDYAPLMDAPQLCEVLSFGCDFPELELASLQAILPGWDSLYLAPEPRPLPPLQIIKPLEGKNMVEPPDRSWTADDDPFALDYCFQRNAGLWMQRTLRAALDAEGLTQKAGVCLGYGDAKRLRNAYTWFSDPMPHTRGLTVRLLGTEAIGQFRRVVQVLRNVLASTRHPWVINLQGKPDPDDDDYEREWIRHPDDEIREEQYRLKEQRKHREFLAREFRLQLLREEGGTPEPADFAAPVPPPPPAKNLPPAPPPPPPEEEEEPEPAPAIPFEPPNLDWSERPPDDAAGGIKEADPENPADDHNEQWLKPPLHVSPNVFWEALSFYLFLTEDTLGTNRDNAEILAWLLARE